MSTITPPPTYDWSVIRGLYEQGHTYTRLKRQFGFAAQSWTKAIKRGDISPKAKPNATPPPRQAEQCDPAVVGERSEAIILAELLRLGYRVLVPFGHSHKYDLAIDHDGKLIRVQCKTARIRKGVIVFNACTSGRRQSYKGVADVFAVYCTMNNKIYFVPVIESGETGVSLRLTATENNQSSGVRMASSYERLDIWRLWR